MICPLCQQPNSRELRIMEILLPFKIPTEELCRECHSQLQLVDPASCCPGCMKADQAGYCPDCRQWQQLYPDYAFKHRTLYYYNDLMKDWLHRYKFDGDYRLRSVFSKELRRALRQYKGYLICPIPLAPEKEQLRGFNQVMGLLAGAGIPTKELLEKPQPSEPQSQKDRWERLATEQPFCLATSADQIKDQKVLLVDDVYTTGRTLFHAAEIIRSAGAYKVETFSLVR